MNKNMGKNQKKKKVDDEEKTKQNKRAKKKYKGSKIKSQRKEKKSITDHESHLLKSNEITKKQDSRNTGNLSGIVEAEPNK